MSVLDTLIETMKSSEAALEQKVDAAVTHLEQTIKSLQTNGVTPQNLTDLQNLQAAISSFVAKPTITITTSVPTAAVPVGSTVQFAADVDVTWAVTGTGTIDANGLYTAPAAAGTDTVTATATDGSGATATATVTVA